MAKMIQEYTFGSIKINDRFYIHDVEVRGNGEVLTWHRVDGHTIDFEDVKRAIEQKPEVIVIGTGYSGAAWVTPRVEKELVERGIKIVIDITPKAIEAFNILVKKERSNKFIGLFHLTC